MDRHQIFLILVASALLFGYGYGLDMPQALQNPLKQAPFNFDNFSFNLLYFFTFIPVTIFLIPIGILIDKYPLRKTLYFFAILSFSSQLVAGLTFQFMIPGYKWILFITRSTFGSCGQALFTIQAILLSLYAKQNYQISMGICLSLPFIMDAVNSITTTHVYDLTKNMELTWYIGAFVAFISLISAIIIDKKYLNNLETQLSIQNQKPLIKKDKQDLISINQSSEQNQQFSFKQLKELDSKFWVLIMAVFFFQSCLGPFFDNLNDLIVKRFNIQYTDAGKMILIPFGLLIFFSLAISKICSKKPIWRRRITLTVSICFFISIFSVYLLPNTKEPTALYYIVICIFLLMISAMFSTEYCALITSITYLVDKKSVGTAYGVCGMALGVSQCFFPLLNSLIMDQITNNEEKSYQNLSLFGSCLGIFPIIFSLWLYRPQFQILDYNLKDDFSQKQISGSQNTIQSINEKLNM